MLAQLQVRVERREGLVVIGNRAGDPRELRAEEETSLVARQRPRARCCHDGEAIECSFLPPYPPFSRARYPANPEGACSKVLRGVALKWTAVDRSEPK